MIRLILGKLLALILAVVVWGGAYVLGNGVIVNQANLPIPDRIWYGLLAGFLVVLGLGLVAEAVGLISSTYTDDALTIKLRHRNGSKPAQTHSDEASQN